MPIKIMLTDSGAAPVLICDVCGGWIQKAADGGYAWNQDRIESGTLHEIAFLHKGNCFLRYEAAHKHTCDQPLEALPPFLASSLSVDWEAASRLARYLATP